MAEDQSKQEKASASRKEEQSDEERQEAGLAKALEEMENDAYVDPSAATIVYPAEIGYSAHALHKGPSTSPSIRERVKAERAKNADPDRDNKVFARDVLGLDVELEEHEDEGSDGIFGGESNVDHKEDKSK